MTVEKRIIDLSDFAEKIRYLSGKDKGQSNRVTLKLDEADDKEDLIIIFKLQDDILVNESYISGLIANSIIAAKSREAFYQKFQFEIQSPQFLSRLNKVVTAALSTGNPFQG